MSQSRGRSYDRVSDVSLLDQIVRKRNEVHTASSAFFWATVNFFVVIAVQFEMSCGYYLLSCKYSYPAVWYSAHVFLAICVISFFKHVICYLKFHWLSSDMELTKRQMKLFGVADDEQGFHLVEPAALAASPISTGPQYSPSSYTGVPSYPGSPSPCLQQSGVGLATPSSARSLLCSPQQGSPAGLSQSLGMSSSYSPTGLRNRSPTAAYQADASFCASANSSLAGNQGSPLSTSNNLAVLFQQDMLAELTGIKNKSRRSHSPKISPLRSDACIQDVNCFDEYLRDHEQKQAKPQADPSQGGAGVSISSFWSYGRTALDCLPALRHYRYQLAPRSPLSPACKDSPTDQLDSTIGEDVWTRLGVTQDQVDCWVENLRKWLNNTILRRLVGEIDEVNKMLIHVGSEDVQIGEASLSTLKQIASVKAQHVPQLTAVLPYIDFVPNQEYLVQRIRDLASGGCMSAFKWNGGADFKGKPWDETLPTDSSILIHLLCTYMDSRLPAHPKYPDGKTFTSQHFLKVPDKPNLVDRKDNLCIYQTRLYPPHFKTVTQNTVWNIKQGRHNLFHALLVFLYHIKTKEHGMLRRINLGMSGINILWVFEL